MSNLAEDIRNKSFQRFYLLYGNDAYLKKSQKNRLVDAVSSKDDLNFMKISGTTLDFRTLTDFVQMLPLMAEKRVLLLEDTEVFKSGSEECYRFLEQVPESAVVIFSEEGIDKRNKCYKYISKNGCIQEVNHLEKGKRDQWIAQFVSKRNLQIEKPAFVYITEHLSEDMEAAYNEITKICDSAMDRGNITLEDVKEIMSPVVENQIFEMISKVSLKDRSGALKIYYDLLFLQEPPMRILYLMNRQVNQLFLIRQMLSERKSEGEIAKALSMNPYIVGKLSRTAGKYSMEELKGFLEYGITLDEDIKKGDIQDRVAVELFIFYLTA